MSDDSTPTPLPWQTDHPASAVRSIPTVAAQMQMQMHMQQQQQQMEMEMHMHMHMQPQPAQIQLVHQVPYQVLPASLLVVVADPMAPNVHALPPNDYLNCMHDTHNVVGHSHSHSHSHSHLYSHLHSHSNINPAHNYNNANNTTGEHHVHVQEDSHTVPAPGNAAALGTDASASASTSAAEATAEEVETGRKQRKDFDFRLKEVKNFKTKFGHCMIPHKFPENPSLGTWVDTQRRRYRKFLDARVGEGTDLNKRGGVMPQEHVDQLIELGFVFEPRLSRKETWSRRIEELQEFKDKHGHCNVREDDTANPGLGKWVSYVRRTHRLAKQKNTSKGKKLSDDRVEHLKTMGFVFELKEELAMKRFRDGVNGLKVFQEKEGHLYVPSFYPENPTFGLCVEDLRTEYRKICQATAEGGDGFSDALSADIVQELAHMGFLAEEGMIPLIGGSAEEPEEVEVNIHI